jgi:hypothetical protein
VKVFFFYLWIFIILGAEPYLMQLGPFLLDVVQTRVENIITDNDKEYQANCIGFCFFILFYFFVI